MSDPVAELILQHGKIRTLDSACRLASGVAIGEGRFLAVGSDAEVLRFRGERTQVIDLNGRTAIPGLNDSHLHLIRGGLNFNLELRWDGLPSLADALEQLRLQARRTPPPQWVRVVGGWSEWQFAERRMPTLEEINAATGETPCFVLHLYDRAWLNAAALRACGYTKDTPHPPGGEIQRDAQGRPTGLLLARPNATILYSTLAKAARLSPEDALVSTRHFMHELNRLGLTSAIDAGGGFQNYPDDYETMAELARRGEMSVRIAYNLFTQHPGQEKEDFVRWIGQTRPGEGDDFYRVNGAGEMLVFSAADFEDFREPRPELAPAMETQLAAVVEVLAKNRWPFRLHATYNESITRMLDVFERVDREFPLARLHWFLDHAETIDERNLERVRRLEGGIAIQDRMAFQGEAFVERYGEEAASRAPPVRRMLDLGIPVGAGTDATRVASYNPWIALAWLITGKSVGGLRLSGESNLLTREEALRLYTQGSSWFSAEEGTKGSISVGQLADLAVLSGDYFSIPEERVSRLVSLLTVVGGRIVHGSAEFSALGPPLPPVSPDWSPTRYRSRPSGSGTVESEHCGCGE